MNELTIINSLAIVKVESQKIFNDIVRFAKHSKLLSLIQIQGYKKKHHHTQPHYSQIVCVNVSVDVMLDWFCNEHEMNKQDYLKQNNFYEKLFDSTLIKHYK